MAPLWQTVSSSSKAELFIAVKKRLRHSGVMTLFLAPGPLEGAQLINCAPFLGLGTHTSLLRM